MGLIDGVVKGALNVVGLGPPKQNSFQPGGGANMPTFAMRKTTDFNQNNPNIQIGGPNAAAAMSQRFNSYRDAANNTANAASQNNADAIARRFAAMGASGSGAQVRLEQQAADKSDQDRQGALSNINNQENEAVQNHDLGQAQMDFQNRVFNFNQASKMHELDLQERQQKIDSASTEYNKELSQFQTQPQKGGLVSNILGGIL